MLNLIKVTIVFSSFSLVGLNNNVQCGADRRQMESKREKLIAAGEKVAIDCSSH